MSSRLNQDYDLIGNDNFFKCSAKLDAEAVHRVQIEKLEEQHRSAADSKVCIQAVLFTVFSSMAKNANSGLIFLLSFHANSCISLIYTKSHDHNKRKIEFIGVKKKTFFHP